MEGVVLLLVVARKALILGWPLATVIFFFLMGGLAFLFEPGLCPGSGGLKGLMVLGLTSAAFHLALCLNSAVEKDGGGVMGPCWSFAAVGGFGFGVVGKLRVSGGSLSGSGLCFLVSFMVEVVSRRHSW